MLILHVVEPSKFKGDPFDRKGKSKYHHLLIKQNPSCI